jgi:hypothetical protein
MSESTSQTILDGIKKVLRSAGNLLQMLDAGEVKAYGNAIANAVAQVVKGRLKRLPIEVREQAQLAVESALYQPSAAKAIEEILRQVVEVSDKTYKQKRDAKPRMTDRDREIVRLRNEFGGKKRRSFGQIAKIFPTINKSWTGKDGKPLNAKTVEVAYYRERDRSAKQ